MRFKMITTRSVLVFLTLSGFVSLSMFGSPRFQPLDYFIAFEDLGIDIIRYVDDDVDAKNPIEYYPESDSIANLDEVNAGPAVDAHLDQPLLGVDVGLRSIMDVIETPHSVFDMLRAFRVELSDADRQKANNLSSYTTFRVDVANVSLFVQRTHGNRLRLSMLEVRNEPGPFRSALPLQANRQEVAEALGVPNFEKSDRSAYIYSSFLTLRQLNIYWDGSRIEKLQYIAWEGI